MRHSELEFLILGLNAAVAMRTVALIARRHMEGLAVIDGKADLTATTVVIAAQGTLGSSDGLVLL